MSPGCLLTSQAKHLNKRPWGDVRAALTKYTHDAFGTLIWDIIVMRVHRKR